MISLCAIRPSDTYIHYITTSVVDEVLSGFVTAIAALVDFARLAKTWLTAVANGVASIRSDPVEGFAEDDCNFQGLISLRPEAIIEDFAAERVARQTVT